MTTVLLIMNCQKYREKAIKQKETWLQFLPKEIHYFHVLGNPALTSEYDLKLEENELWVKNKDDYNSLPHKVIMAYKAIHELFEDTQYIFKTDDDQHLENPEKFFGVILKLLREKTPKIHYGGNVVDVKNSYLSKYHTIHPELPTYLPVLKTKYCSGRFYFLSKEACAYLICADTKEKISNEYLEDYAIGYYLKDEFKNNIFHIDTSKYFKDN
jgi:hypothetical protein